MKRKAFLEEFNELMEKYRVRIKPGTDNKLHVLFIETKEELTLDLKTSNEEKTH